MRVTNRIVVESAAAVGSMTQVYFPTAAIVSLVGVMEDGASAEIAIVGHECLRR